MSNLYRLQCQTDVNFILRIFAGHESQISKPQTKQLFSVELPTVSKPKGREHSAYFLTLIVHHKSVTQANVCNTEFCSEGKLLADKVWTVVHAIVHPPTLFAIHKHNLWPSRTLLTSLAVTPSSSLRWRTGCCFGTVEINYTSKISKGKTCMGS